MSGMINFGIDLGTTNSLIAKFNKGAVEVFKNPNGFKETLPSVIGFRNDRIQVGDQAKAYLERDPKSVAARFKRKMGTAESFRIHSLGQSKTPVELSAFVLKELKTFVHTGETPEAVVITIPASFDTVQSNATKEAGHLAGFKHVVLLQEPIAASLAYANREKNVDLNGSQWIVYDLGGGTFDVALVRIVNGELKVTDHEGDNYLGGCDFDTLLVEKIVVPRLEKLGNFTNLPAQMKSEAGKYNKLWYVLLNHAEQAKIELSTKTSSEIEVTCEDDTGKTIDALIPVTRSDFEALIRNAIDDTVVMLGKILTRNSLRPGDLAFVLMVGGSTYIPLVRKRVEELLGIPVNTKIDPTNAIVVGAAYFAATKEVGAVEATPAERIGAAPLKIRVAYNRASREKDELFSAKVEGGVAGLFYRIVREDGGFDSGLRPLAQRISEELPLQEDTYNVFSLRVFDNHNNPVAISCDPIQIAQGKYSVAGQMLPEDLCLVKDDLNTGDTKLDRIFAKNSILPCKTKKTVDVSKAIIHGSEDEIRIIVVEGSADNHFTANKPVGDLVISGKMLRKDIFRGTEIDLSFEMSESRELTVTAYVNPSGPNFSQVCTLNKRDVRPNILLEEIGLLERMCDRERAEAKESEKFEAYEGLEKLSVPLKTLRDEAIILTVDDVTDNRYKLEDRKRRLAQELNQWTVERRIERRRAEYEDAKAETRALVGESGNDHERRHLSELLAREHTFIGSSSPQKLDDAIKSLQALSFQILRRTPVFLKQWFEFLASRREVFNDQLQAKNLLESGKRHIAAEDYEHLAEVNARLHNLLPQAEQDSKEMRYFTGIS